MINEAKNKYAVCLIRDLQLTTVYHFAFIQWLIQMDGFQQ